MSWLCGCCTRSARASVVLFLGTFTSFSRGLYDPVRRVESARLYGNIAQYAYYYVDLTVGTPPQRVSVILDTGSGLLAFPCAGCPHCGKHIDPPFDIEKSDSAKWVPCGGGGCRGTCTKGHCSYRQSYLEGSSISGYWFEDFVRLGDTIQHNPPVKAKMGCHQNENKLFYTQKANGIFGIQGPTTLLNELFADKKHVDSNKFSVCLASEGGRLTVGGHNDTYHRAEPQYVPQLGSSYSVKLTHVTINGKTIENFKTTMIDSGTTYTYFNRVHYKALRDGIEAYCKNNRCRATNKHTCWTVTGDLESFPVVEVVFVGNVVTRWHAREYLFKNGRGNQTWCYAFQDDGARTTTTLGASWMLYKEVIFDLKNKRIGIAPADCPENRDRPAHTTGGAILTPEGAISPPNPAPPPPPVGTTVGVPADVEKSKHPPKPVVEPSAHHGAEAPVDKAKAAAQAGAGAEQAEAATPAQAWSSTKSVPWTTDPKTNDDKKADDKNGASARRNRVLKLALSVGLVSLLAATALLCCALQWMDSDPPDGAPHERERIAGTESGNPGADVVGREFSGQSGQSVEEGAAGNGEGDGPAPGPAQREKGEERLGIIPKDGLE